MRRRLTQTRVVERSGSIGSRGFSFPELIAVLGVISLLACLLQPLFLRARDRARETHCGSNLTQLSLGLQLYAADFDGRFPTKEVVWTSAIERYTKNWDLLRCPTHAIHRRRFAEVDSAGRLISYRYRSGLTLDSWDDEILLHELDFFHGTRALGVTVAGYRKELQQVPASNP